MKCHWFNVGSGGLIAGCPFSDGILIQSGPLRSDVPVEACAVRSGQRSRRRGSGGLLALRVDAWPPRGWSGRAPCGAAVSGGRRCPLGLWLGGGASGFTLGSCQPPSALDLSARHIPCFRPKLIVHSNVSKWFENAIFFFLKKKNKKAVEWDSVFGKTPEAGGARAAATRCVPFDPHPLRSPAERGRGARTFVHVAL